MLKMGSVSVAGISNIDGKDVVYFNATFGGVNKSFSSTKNITDIETYQKHQEECDADFDEFTQTAMDIMSQTKEV